MADYIDREELLESLQAGYECEEAPCWSTCPWLEDEIKRVPSVDSVEVVRCKDCKHELDKLEQWLAKNNYNYERITRLPFNYGGLPDIEAEICTVFDKRTGERNQLVVYDLQNKKLWDAICQYGSYGYREGLLEIYGCLCDDVEGYLTADDVIERVKKYEARTS